MFNNMMLRGTIMNALPFMDQTSDINTDSNSHFARILQNSQVIRPMPVVPTQPKMKETTSTFKHEAGPPCSSSSSGCDDRTPPSSGPPGTVSTPKLNLPVETVLSPGDSSLDGVGSSSTTDGQKSRISIPPADPSNLIRVEHPSSKVRWQHLTDAVRAACSVPPKHRRLSTIMDQCLRDVMLAERMPEQLLKILPEDSDAVLMKDGSNLAQQTSLIWTYGKRRTHSIVKTTPWTSSSLICPSFVRNCTSSLPGVCFSRPHHALEGFWI